MNKIYIGFHGTLKENKESIENNGFKKSISTDKQHWLGEGVYFFEDEYYAVEWNVLDIKKKRKEGINLKPSDYIILKAFIMCNSNKMLDMSSPEGIVLYKYFKDKLKEKYIKEGNQSEINKLNGRSTKFWMNALADNGFFDEFDVLLASYVRTIQELGKNDDDFIKNHQRQICVRETKCIYSVREYNDIDRVKDLYRIIIKNRKIEMIGEYNE